jgi:hypothetical protein
MRSPPQQNQGDSKPSTDKPGPNSKSKSALQGEEPGTRAGLFY